MKDEFTPYDIALALKELGFNDVCFGYYTTTYKDDLIKEGIKGCVNSALTTAEIAAPIHQQAFRWFREQHGKNVVLFSDGYQWTFDLRWTDIDDISNYPFVQFPTKESRREMFDTFEEAELASLKKLIEIVKQK